MTPRQFVWLRERHKHERQYNELLWGINTATLANHSFSGPTKKEKMYKPFDFMPSKWAEKKEEQARLPNNKPWTRKGFAQSLIAMRESFMSDPETKGLFRFNPAPAKQTQK